MYKIELVREVIYPRYVREKLRRLHNWINKYEWLILLLGLVVVFRIPSLFEPHHYGDEEIYFVMGRGFREGVPFYSGIFDHKPPLIYILAGVAKSVFWFRFALMIWMVLYTVCFWFLSRWFWDGFNISGRKKSVLSFMSSAVFVFLSSWPGLEGEIANGELFMMFPAVLGISMIVKMKSGGSLWRFFGAGFVAGIGFLFKIPVVFDVIGVGLVYFAFKPSLRDSVKGLFSKELWASVFGFVSPFLITSVYYFLRGIGRDYIKGVLLINLGYTSSYATASYSFNPFASGLFIRAMIVFLFVGLLFLLRNRLSKRFVFVMVWLSFSAFGALLSARPYPHYLQQLVPAFSLLVPMMFVIENWIEWVGVGAVVLLGWWTQKKIKFWYYPTVAYYKNFIDLGLGRKSRKEYLDYFSNYRYNSLVADYLRPRLKPDDDIYIWGTDPAVYNLLDKMPAGGRYIVSFHVRDFKAYDYTMSNIMKNKPSYILVPDNPIPFRALFAFIEAKYTKVAEVGGFKIYRYIDYE